MLKKRFIPLPSFGFTLLETMITVAVASILIAAAVPSFTAYLERKRVQAEANVINDFFAQARNAALTRLTNVEVCWNPTNAVDANNVPARSIASAILPSGGNPLEILSVKEFSSDETYISDDEPDKCATIDVQGRLVINSVTGNSLAFGICKDNDGVLDDSFAITVGRSGRPSIQKNDGSEVDCT